MPYHQIITYKWHQIFHFLGENRAAADTQVNDHLRTAGDTIHSQYPQSVFLFYKHTSAKHKIKRVSSDPTAYHWMKITLVINHFKIRYLPFWLKIREMTQDNIPINIEFSKKRSSIRETAYLSKNVAIYPKTDLKVANRWQFHWQFC